MKQPVVFKYGKKIGEDQQHVWVEFSREDINNLNQAMRDLQKEINAFKTFYGHNYKAFGMKTVSIVFEFDKKVR